MNTISSPAVAKTTNRFRSRSSLAFAAMVLFSASSWVQGQLVTFGNFGPGVDPRGGSADAIFTAVRSDQWAAVALTTGSQALQIQSIDMGLSATLSNPAGFRLVLSEFDLPTLPLVLTFSTTQTFSTSADFPERMTFTPDAAFTLQSNTTYFLRLEGDDTMVGPVNWHRTAIGSPTVLSDYSTYNFTYSQYDGFSNLDRGAYFVTATVVPEASTSALLIGGIAVLLGLARRLRRRKVSE